MISSNKEAAARPGEIIQVGDLRPIVVFPREAILEIEHVAAGLGVGIRSVERQHYPAFYLGTRTRRFADAPLVPRTPPIAPRSSRESHTGLSWPLPGYPATGKSGSGLGINREDASLMLGLSTASSRAPATTRSCRRCPEAIASRKLLCDSCRKSARQANHRRQMQRWWARQPEHSRNALYKRQWGHQQRRFSHLTPELQGVVTIIGNLRRRISEEQNRRPA